MNIDTTRTGTWTGQTLPDGNAVTRSYDALNPCMEISTASIAKYQMARDLDGNVVQAQESDPANPNLNRVVTNLYVLINRMTNEIFSTLPLVPSGGGGGYPTYCPSAGTITQVTTYGYDNALNQICSWTDVTNEVTYGYDANWSRTNRTQVGDPNGANSAEWQHGGAQPRCTQPVHEDAGWTSFAPAVILALQVHDAPRGSFSAPGLQLHYLSPDARAAYPGGVSLYARHIPAPPK